MHVSKLPSPGTSFHLPDSCRSGQGVRNVFLLLLRTSWLMSAENALLYGARCQARPPRGPNKPQGQLAGFQPLLWTGAVSLHSVTQNLYGQQCWGRWEEHTYTAHHHTHSEWVIQSHWEPPLTRLDSHPGDFCHRLCPVRPMTDCTCSSTLDRENLKGHLVGGARPSGHTSRGPPMS